MCYWAAPVRSFCYRIAPRHVRLILDVPLHGPAGRERAAFLWDGYADVLPGALRAPFRRVLAAGAFEGAANGVRGRVSSPAPAGQPGGGAFGRGAL